MIATDLYAVATETDGRARVAAHEADPHYPRACAPRCWRCYLEARARLYGRAGDAAAELENRET